MFNKFRSVVLFSKILVTLVLSREFELEKYVLKRNIIKFIKNQRVLWGSIYKDCLSLLCLAVVMTVFAVAILKSNLERVPKQNIYMSITFCENS